MNATKIFQLSATATLFLAAAFAQSATVTGTVTDKTTGKPAAGDTVVLVDVQAGMGEVAHATTNAQGHYSLNEPGSGPYLIRVTHQGAGYFIAAPQGAAPGDIPVYDVAAKVDGVFIEADVLEIEGDNNQLHVTERYFVHNTSSPPRTEWSPRTFAIALPPEAEIAGVAAQRPTGLPTSVKLDPAGAKGQYAFNFPIQPDEGDKDTLFQVDYTLPYTSGKFVFHPRVSLPAQSVGILLPKSMTFAAGSGSTFQSVQQDPNIQTFVAKNATPGQALEFTVSGTGSMPRETQADNGAQAAGAPGNQPGGGIGAPINTPDPLSKYKWWILGGLGLLMATAAGFLLRRPAAAAAGANIAVPFEPALPVAHSFASSASPATKNSALLAALKEELFALESEKINGTLSAADYAEVKPALEIVLKRALKRSS
ncbi:MAG TPA: carboxypeptidase-like regulatory domain-containing protein [Terracidiphilus sp.]|nr:carboxypeptidase-like regulatory domain-containing protein [Terracidiphilus sp.]